MPHYNVNPTDAALFADRTAVRPHHEAAWKTETERVQRVRGEILSITFEVESSIDYAIADCILPVRRTFRTPRWIEERHWLFQNEVLIRFDFRTKIEIMSSLLLHRFPRNRRKIDKLTSLLNRVRDVRNRAAHAPVYFQALEKQISGRWLKPYLMTSKGMIHLSDGYLRTFRDESCESMKILREMMRQGLKIKPPQITEWAQVV